jgi:(1->4)-alpha-D-glucan 1-alpha-D-glucosylmutase
MTAPSSTYRLQISGDFDLFAAGNLCDYLSDLGVGAVYCSPLLKAVPGSQHGYDVVDHAVIDPARGGQAGWQSLLAAAGDNQLGLVIDIVPNHLGVAVPHESLAWWDVLRLGRSSPWSSWFDIDWDAGRILLPILGDDFDEAELSVLNGELRYRDQRFPLGPGTEGGSPSQVHDRQAYQLVNQRQGAATLNYRRFFAVSSLAGLRVEDEEVYSATHQEILRWVREDGITGLRIDHPDGLADPAGYLARLRESSPLAWITVEKILETGERLPPSWPVAGTTGYDALADVTNVLVDPAGELPMTELYQDLTGDTHAFADHAAAGKRLQVETNLRAEVARLARLAPEVALANAALGELAVAFPVYRSYLPDGREHLEHAAFATRRRRPELAEPIEALLPRLANPQDELACRFQQLTGAVMAKGVEDTAYYRYTRFVALNEVGGDPSRFGGGLDAFHEAMATRQREWPASMTTLTTHDTKRGEDVRARLFALAELASDWTDAAHELMGDAPSSSPTLSYLLWQTFAGAGLIDRARMHAYAEKAMREAAVQTSWIDPSLEFEAEFHHLVDSAYDVPRLRLRLSRMISRGAPAARSNILSQKLVQLTMPGVPDVYQGTELLEDSLVDPDNRRPVDFGLRRELLSASPRDGSREKLLVTVGALRLRREQPGWFGSYRRVPVSGDRAEHAIAYDRGGALAVATRLPVGLAASGGWGATRVELRGGYTDVLTGRQVHDTQLLGSLLRDLPVALLVPRRTT